MTKPRLLPHPAATAFRNQARACASMGSPFTAALCHCVADHGLPDGTTWQRIAHWPGIDVLAGDAVALRLAGGLHALVLGGRDDGLAAVYPPHSATPEELGSAVHAAVIRHDPWLEAFLDSPPQTNEIARSAILLPALQTLSTRFPGQFELLELGASAGLNQNMDRYCCDYGSWSAGDPGSAATIPCDWKGAIPPPASEFAILSRRGCDIAPIDLNDPAALLRLRAYVWADQTARIERLDAALAIAKDYPPQIDAAGATSWLENQLAKARAAPHRVILHTIMWQYLPESEKRRIENLIRNAGRDATSFEPLSWVRCEPDGAKPGAAILSSTWSGSPDDGVPTILGRADYHGRWIEWH